MLKVKEGDLDKLGLLFERHKKVLFGFFYNMSHNAELSEDLVQNVFVRILKYKHSFKGDGQFKTWMFHISRNVNNDHYRKNKLGETDDIEDWQDRLGDKDADRAEKQEEDIRLLKRAMERLDQEKREILTLSKLEGMKYKEIGDVLSCSEGAVKVKVFRALKDLKKIYQVLHTQVYG
ncbi:MAG: RNA polymerase sigma factor [Bacteroidota bacterium]